MQRKQQTWIAALCTVLVYRTVRITGSYRTRRYCGTVVGVAISVSASTVPYRALPTYVIRAWCGCKGYGTVPYRTYCTDEVCSERAYVLYRYISTVCCTLPYTARRRILVILFEPPDRAIAPHLYLARCGSLPPESHKVVDIVGDKPNQTKTKQLAE